MRAAGAILLGKTNCPTYGGGIETDNPVSGRTNNPYDLERTPGGSSGGEAAAIAAGCSPCGLGTDSGASVRLPAHFCGLAAIKPTSGRVPVTGVLDDLGQIGALGDPRTQVGVLARSAADVALLLGVVAGPDGRDGGVAPVPLAEPGDVARAARRDAHPQRPRHARPRHHRRRPRRRARPARRRRHDRGGRAAARRPRAHDRRLALLRRRVQRRAALRAAAPLGRLPRRDAHLVRRPRPRPLPRLPRARPPPRRHEPPRRARPHQLHDALLPHRLARRHRPRRQLARGPADRRPARRPPVARRRRPRRRRACRAALGGYQPPPL